LKNPPKPGRGNHKEGAQRKVKGNMNGGFLCKMSQGGEEFWVVFWTTGRIYLEHGIAYGPVGC